ncbi:MAG: hypothetical protein MZV64_19415 [Ignavibacteriales bacterium]|nr:hypothetical protein [Ignavibacteriales bacterium]
MRKDQPSLSEKRGGRAWPVIRGIVIALPVIAVFASLLSAADPIFEERFDEFVRLFNIENLPEYIFRLVYILIFAYALAGTYLHAAQKIGRERWMGSLWSLRSSGLPKRRSCWGVWRCCSPCS